MHNTVKTRSTHTSVALSTSLSQNRITCQPSSVNWAVTALSRQMVPSILGIQKALLLFMAAAASGHPRPCQNEESQKIATLADTTTKSGQPGSFLYCLRYRIPTRQSAEPKVRSIKEPERRTLDMLKLICSFVFTVARRCPPVCE